MLNIRSTLADEAETPKNFFAKGAKIGNEFSCGFQKIKGYVYEELVTKLEYFSIIASMLSKLSQLLDGTSLSRQLYWETVGLLDVAYKSVLSCCVNWYDWRLSNSLVLRADIHGYTRELDTESAFVK